MPADQIIIGSIVAGLCAFGIWHRNWLLVETRKGRWLVNRWGRPRAGRILTIMLIALVSLCRVDVCDAYSVRRPACIPDRR
jgi:hypothetical protein